MGFQMGDDDAPFSQRMWGLGRQLHPTQRGRTGCMVMLLAALALVVIALVIAAIAGTL